MPEEKVELGKYNGKFIPQPLWHHRWMLEERVEIGKYNCGFIPPSLWHNRRGGCLKRTWS